METTIRVCGFRVRAKGLGFRVWGLQGLGFTGFGLYRVWGLQGLRFRGWDFRLGLQGSTSGVLV